MFFWFFFFRKNTMFAKKNATLIAVEFASFVGLFPTLGVIQYLLYILKVASFYDFWRNQIYASLYTDVYHDRLHSTWWLQTFNKGCSNIRTIQSENMKNTFKPIINHKQQTTSAVSEENSHQSKVFSPKMKLSILPMT